MTAIALAVGWIGCFVTLNILLKSGVQRIDPGSGFVAMARDLAASPWLYLAVVLYGACALVYLISLRFLPLSTAGPIYMTLGVVASALTGLIYFAEPLSALKIGGVALCVTGIALLALGNGAA